MLKIARYGYSDLRASNVIDKYQFDRITYQIDSVLSIIFRMRKKT
jgi:hypothetical protein